MPGRRVAVAQIDPVVGDLDAAEWKRRQYPPGPEISLEDFGRDRRPPIENRWREKA